ncbi:unnamed protein product [marine sediment metagenome]|uniref:Uncharacterized protein n=1 Tax=marine sediment metagenome TaxID=412755 RepID=X0W023_9ZZZZ
MWLIPTKKEVKKSFNKIKSHIKELTAQSLKNKEDINSNKEKIARLEGAISVLLKSQSHSNLRQSQKVFETKVVQKVRRNKKALVMSEISKLIPSMSVIDVFDIIVKEKGLCSKASFYRYIQSLKKSNEIKLRQN